MMFSAGMGIGLMFYARRRADLAHGRAAGSARRSRARRGRASTAMSISYFHWALHPWAIYAIVGLALAYFTLPPGHAEPDQLGASTRCSATA